MNILILDNYDSFTYNLVSIAKQLPIQLEVIRNDKIEPIAALNYDGIILSPGPGIPSEAGIMPDLIQVCAGKLPILGVCLGHQAIAAHYGGTLRNMKQVFHGIQSTIKQSTKKSIVLNGLGSEFQAGRYHSWVVERAGLPDNLRITAVDENDEIMGLESIAQKIFGVQFHPESIMTPDGHLMIKNFITFCKESLR